jgi:hypothetical protein
MGLDMYAHTRNQKVDFGKVYEDDYNPCKHGFLLEKTFSSSYIYD